jgi:hypothetical protein
MENNIYFKKTDSAEQSKMLISEYSFSAKMSIDMGGPSNDHGGYKLEAKNGYIAKTSGGVIYGYINETGGLAQQSCAILGFCKKGTLTEKLEKDGWIKTTVFNWAANLEVGLTSGWLNTDACIYTPSIFNPEKGV